MKIYLAGSVPKGSEEEKGFVNWRLKYIEILEKFLDSEFILPDTAQVDENDTLLVVGKDSKSIKSADLVIVNAENRLGAGTSMEMVIAKYFKKPVITVIPKDTHHRRSNINFRDKYFVEDWIHPFVHTFSDFVVESVAEIEKIKDQLLSSKPKDISIIDTAIEHRENNPITK